MRFEEVRRFPLLKWFDFVSYTVGNARSLELLIPENDNNVYARRRYGPTELLFLPYIQGPFNRGRSTTVDSILERHAKYREREDYDENRESLAMMINKGMRHGIIVIGEKPSTVKISGTMLRRHPLMQIARGEKYDRIRVLKFSQLILPFDSFRMQRSDLPVIAE